MASGIVGHDKKHCPIPDKFPPKNPLWPGQLVFPSEGQIWKCECGQLWVARFKGLSLSLSWKRISEWKRKRLEFRDD